jgi:hypothetical protein
VPSSQVKASRTTESPSPDSRCRRTVERRACGRRCSQANNVSRGYSVKGFLFEGWRDSSWMVGNPSTTSCGSSAKTTSICAVIQELTGRYIAARATLDIETIPPIGFVNTSPSRRSPSRLKGPMPPSLNKSIHRTCATLYVDATCRIGIRR